MFFQRPPRNGFGLGTNFNQDPFGNSLVAETRPQLRPQPMMNSGYPVLDLIAGLGQVFNREPMTTPPYIPPQQSGDWGMGKPDDGSIFSGGIFGPMVIEENPQPKPRPEYDIWGNPITRYPMDERPSPKEKYAFDFPKIWNDDTEQQDWLNRWDIQPANDARYLPTFPEPDDTSTGAAIRRDWHNSYKDFAKNTIGQHAPMFAESMPQPQPQQSYGDFMGEIKLVANTMVNNAASTFGSGLGQALSFIPGLGPIMELIGHGANIASTVAGATGLGGEKAGAALNLIGSVANGAAGGANTAGAEEFGPPAPNGFGAASPPMPNEGGMFSGLRPNPQPAPTAPSTPPFKPQPAPTTSDGEGNWFKPLDQMIAEIDERQARGEIFDEKTNSWVKRQNTATESAVPQPGSGTTKQDVPKQKIDPIIITPKQTGEEAVAKATQKVDQLFGKGDFLKDIAYVESKYGEDPNTFKDRVQTPGKAAEPYHGGIWQVDKIAFDATKDTKSHPSLAKHHQKIKDELGIDWQKVKYEDLTSPINSALAARLKLLTIPDKIPDDSKGRAEYWKNHYNTGAGKGSPDKFQRDIDARNKKNTPR